MHTVCLALWVLWGLQAFPESVVPMVPEALKARGATLVCLDLLAHLGCLDLQASVEHLAMMVRLALLVENTQRKSCGEYVLQF